MDPEVPLKGLFLLLPLVLLLSGYATSEAFETALDGHLGKRTQRLGREIREHLLARQADEGKATSIAREVADLFGKLKSEKDSPDKVVYIEQLAFVSPAERKAALALADSILDGTRPEKLDSSLVLKETDGAVDIAMFGRMLADDPQYNREAAVQVAHAITTHTVLVEDDFYTAVDDLKSPGEDAGAGFVGEAGFASGVFYLYLCINRDLLVRNLGGGSETLANSAIGALIEAAATVSPKGKQASFASRARASFIMVEKGTHAPRTLATAFLKPIKSANDEMEASIDALQRTSEAFAAAYGETISSKAMNAHEPNGVTLQDIIQFAAE